MQKKGILEKISIINLVALLVALFAPMAFFSEKVSAANLQQAYVRLDRMKAAEPTSGLVCVKTPVGNSATENDVQVVFPSDFTVSTTLTDWAVATTNLPNGATAWPGIGQATVANNGTKTVTFPSTNLAADTLYCFRWTNTAALTNGAAGNNREGTITTRDNVSTAIDSQKYTTAIITDDQIVVSAVVPPIFSFSLSGNTDTFSADLSPTTVRSTAGRTATVATNAPNGWVAWVKSANAGLTSVAASSTIATAGSVDNTPSDLASTTGYVLDVSFTDSGNGTGVVSQAANWGQEYDGNGTTSGGTLDTNFQPIAASTGTTDGDTMTLIERAKITSYQPPATDYTDTLTVVAAGRF